MSNKSKDSISIANILAVIGLVGLGVLSFFGLYFQSQDGSPTKPLIVAVAIAAGLAILLILSVKAKAANDNPDKWRIVEIICVLLYLTVAALCAKPFLHFFKVVSEKEQIQKEARAEIAAVEDLYSTYKTQTQDFMADAVEQFKNFSKSSQGLVAGDPLSDYYNNIIVGNVDDWADLSHSLLSLPVDARLADLKSQVSNWNYLKLPQLAKDLKAAEDRAWKQVNAKIAFGNDHNLIPVVNGGDGIPYSLGEFAAYSLPGQCKPTMAAHIQKPGATTLGWVLYVVLHLLILLDYLVAPRSTFVGPSKATSSNGLDL